MYRKRRVAFLLGLTVLISLITSIVKTDSPVDKVTIDNDPVKQLVEELPQNYTATDWRIKLVNRENPISDELNIELYTLGSGEQVNEKIVSEYVAMIEAAEKVGLYLTTISGYRSIDYQEILYNATLSEYLAENYLFEEAQRKTEEYVQLPKSSEHHTGLAVDIASQKFKDSGADLTEDLADTKEYQWLLENASDYGFILRYPKGKEEITGIHYEPWHFRYVGKDMAKFMEQNNLTLEEIHELYE